jgi:hypothetical protein
VRYVPLSDNAPANGEGLEAHFRTILNPQARVTLTPLSVLAREKSGKFEIMKCLIGRDDA